MKSRIILTKDEHLFINVTDIALTLWHTNMVELFELDYELNESLISSQERLNELIESGEVVAMDGFFNY
jgi:hypothetical protein